MAIRITDYRKTEVLADKIQEICGVSKDEADKQE
jgi:hypothetical protein